MIIEPFILNFSKILKIYTYEYFKRKKIENGRLKWVNILFVDKPSKFFKKFSFYDVFMSSDLIIIFSNVL